jgi:two-component system, LytTR family, response regulator LytT
MKIVIIEDEKPTARDLAKTITAVEPDADIVEILHSVEDALKYFQNDEDIDLIFSDIQLGDGISFEIFETLKKKIPIIFCTAFNQYAINAFNTAGIHYLLKPFSKNTVTKALTKYHDLKKNFSSSPIDQFTILNELKNQLHPTKIPSIIVHQADKIIPVDGSDIALFYIENNLVIGYSFHGKKWTVTQQLDKLESTFHGFFFRANRQFLVNRKAIKDASHHFNRKMQVNLTIPFPDQILVGKLKVTAFLNWLAQH